MPPAEMWHDRIRNGCRQTGLGNENVVMRLTTMGSCAETMKILGDAFPSFKSHRLQVLEDLRKSGNQVQTKIHHFSTVRCGLGSSTVISVLKSSTCTYCTLFTIY